MRWSACNGKSLQFSSPWPPSIRRKLGWRRSCGRRHGRAPSARLRYRQTASRLEITTSFHSRPDEAVFFPVDFVAFQSVSSRQGRLFFVFSFSMNERETQVVLLVPRCCLIGADGCLRTLIITALQGLEHYRMIYNSTSESVVTGSTIQNEERELAGGN